MQKNNSVSSLFVRKGVSLECGIPLNDNKMLSTSSDIYKVKRFQQEQQQKYLQELNNSHNKMVLKIQNEDADALEQLLDLKNTNILEERSEHQIQVDEGHDEQQELQKAPKIKLNQDTKNLLRNFGNAQNQAEKTIKKYIYDPSKFYSWVRKLRLQNFQQFKLVWSGQNQNRVYTKVYRELCWTFYKQQANEKLSHQNYSLEIYIQIYGRDRQPSQFQLFQKTVTKHDHFIKINIIYVQLVILLCRLRTTVLIVSFIFACCSNYHYIHIF